MSKTTSLSLLPLEILTAVIGYLSPREVFRLKRLSQDFNQRIIPYLTASIEFAATNLARNVDRYSCVELEYWPHLGRSYVIAALTSILPDETIFNYLCPALKSLRDDSPDIDVNTPIHPKDLSAIVKESIQQLQPDRSRLHDFYSEYCTRLYELVGASNDVELLKLLDDTVPDDVWDSTYALDTMYKTSLGFGSLEVVEFIVKAGFKPTPYELGVSMRSKNVSLFTFLREELLQDTNPMFQYNPFKLMEENTRYGCSPEMLDILVEDMKAALLNPQQNQAGNFADTMTKTLLSISLGEFENPTYLMRHMIKLMQDNDTVLSTDTASKLLSRKYYYPDALPFLLTQPIIRDLLTMSPFRYTPIEVISQILCWLHPHQVFQLKRVNKDFNQRIIPYLTSNLQFAAMNLQLLWEKEYVEHNKKYLEHNVKPGFLISLRTWPHLGRQYAVALLTRTKPTHLGLRLLSPNMDELIYLPKLGFVYSSVTDLRLRFKELREIVSASIWTVPQSNVNTFYDAFGNHILRISLSLGDVQLFDCLMQKIPIASKAGIRALSVPTETFSLACRYGNLTMATHLLNRDPNLTIGSQDIVQAMKSKCMETVMYLRSECLKDGNRRENPDDPFDPLELVPEAARAQCPDMIPVFLNDARTTLKASYGDWGDVATRERSMKYKLEEALNLALVSSVGTGSDNAATVNAVIDLLLANNMVLNANTTSDSLGCVQHCEDVTFIKALLRHPDMRRRASFEYNLLDRAIEDRKLEFLQVLAPVYDKNVLKQYLKDVDGWDEGAEVLKQLLLHTGE